MPAASVAADDPVHLVSRPLVATILATVAFDQLTKQWAVANLTDGRVVEVAWTLQFALGFNSGFAFGSGQGKGILVGSVAVLVVGYMLVMLRGAKDAATAWGLAFVIGGAIGNILDRLFRNDGWMRGKVVDFIDLQWWPVFNVADSAITVGGALLLVGMFLQWRREHGGGSQTEGSAA